MNLPRVAWQRMSHVHLPDPLRQEFTLCGAHVPEEEPRTEVVWMESDATVTCGSCLRAEKARAKG